MPGTNERAFSFLREIDPQELQKLGLEEQVHQLTQVDRDGLNTLLFAIYKQPEVVPALLQIIKQFKPDQQFKILNQLYGQYNALIVCINGNLHFAKLILEITSTWGSDMQAEYYTSYSYLSPIFYALSRPEIFNLLIDIIKKFNLHQSKNFNLYDDFLVNAQANGQLKIALNFIKLFDTEKQRKLLTYDMSRSNLIRSDPRDGILEAMEILTCEQQIEMLDWWTPRIPGYINQYRLVDTLSEGGKIKFLKKICTSNLHLRAKYTLLSPLTPSFLRGEGKIPKEAMNCVNEVIWEYDLKQLLEQLKPAASESTDSPQAILHQSLEADLELYLKSPKDPNNLKAFHSSWNRTLHQARTNPKLNDDIPQIKDIVITALLIISVIGMLYLGFKGINNDIQKRSMFFPSRFEEELNNLEDQAFSNRPALS